MTGRRELLYHCTPSFARALEELGLKTWLGARPVAGPGQPVPELVEVYKETIMSLVKLAATE